MRLGTYYNAADVRNLCDLNDDGIVWISYSQTRGIGNKNVLIGFYKSTMGGWQPGKTTAFVSKEKRYIIIYILTSMYQLHNMPLLNIKIDYSLGTQIYMYFTVFLPIQIVVVI